MSNEMESKMSAALGKSSGAQSDTDWKSRAEELERMLQKERVEGGRLKKTNEELDALRRENEELKAKRREEELISSIPDDERSAVPDEVLNVAAKMAKKAEERFDARLRDIEDARRRDAEERREDARRGIVAKVTSYCPRFLDDVSEGSDKFAAWCEYKRFNMASITEAFANGDFDTLKYHIDAFYNSKLGIPVPTSGQDGSAAPDPRNNGGGGEAGQPIQGKVYTEEEFLALYDKVEEARSKGDYAEMKRLDREIKLAPAEGRVK